MVVLVEYHIPKKYFKQHKEKFQELIGKQDFQIAIMKFEKELSTHEIAKYYDIEEIQVRRTLSSICKILRKNGFRI